MTEKTDWHWGWFVPKISKSDFHPDKEVELKVCRRSQVQFISATVNNFLANWPWLLPLILTQTSEGFNVWLNRILVLRLWLEQNSNSKDLLQYVVQFWHTEIVIFAEHVAWESLMTLKG